MNTNYTSNKIRNIIVSLEAEANMFAKDPRTFAIYCKHQEEIEEWRKELKEQERVERSGLTYDQALDLIDRLMEERMSMKQDIDDYVEARRPAGFMARW